MAFEVPRIPRSMSQAVGFAGNYCPEFSSMLVPPEPLHYERRAAYGKVPLFLVLRAPRRLNTTTDTHMMTKDR